MRNGLCALPRAGVPRMILSPRAKGRSRQHDPTPSDQKCADMRQAKYNQSSCFVSFARMGRGDVSNPKVNCLLVWCRFVDLFPKIFKRAGTV
jgi:hypothetical protein